jgi:hypothetical protein
MCQLFNNTAYKDKKKFLQNLNNFMYIEYMFLRHNFDKHLSFKEYECVHDNAMNLKETVGFI